MRISDFESDGSSRPGWLIHRLLKGVSTRAKDGAARMRPAPAPEDTFRNGSHRPGPHAGPRRNPRRRAESLRLRFGDFEFEPATRELSGPNGTVRLQPQPARLLHLLLENDGAVVSRGEVRRGLWPDEIHVEFDQSMNTCVKRIRAALDDSAEAPRYVETLPRLGYRFLAPVTQVVPASGLPNLRGGSRGHRLLFLLVAVLGAAALIAGAFAWRRPAPPPCGGGEPTTTSGLAAATRPDTPPDSDLPPGP